MSMTVCNSLIQSRSVHTMCASAQTRDVQLQLLPDRAIIICKPNKAAAGAQNMFGIPVFCSQQLLTCTCTDILPHRTHLPSDLCSAYYTGRTTCERGRHRAADCLAPRCMHLHLHHGNWQLLSPQCACCLHGANMHPVPQKCRFVLMLATFQRCRRLVISALEILIRGASQQQCAVVYVDMAKNARSRFEQFEPGPLQRSR